MKRILIVVNGNIIERHTAPDEAEVVVIDAEDWDGDGPDYGAVDNLDGMDELAEVPDPLAAIDDLYDWDDDETERTSDE